MKVCRINQIILVAKCIITFVIKYAKNFGCSLKASHMCSIIIIILKRTS